MFVALQIAWALKSSIKIKLSYALKKKLIIRVKYFRNRESKSKGGLYINITKHFSFFSFNSKGKARILDWNLGKES